MSIIEKYGLPVSPDAESIDAWDAVLDSLVQKINAPEPEKSGDKVASVDVLDQKYGKDQDGIDAARSFLRNDGGVLDQIVAYCDDDPSRTFHLLNALKDQAVTYLTNECAYFRKVDAPKTVTVNEKSVLRAEFNELRKVFNGLAAVFVALNPTAGTGGTIVVKNGKAEYRTAGFRGPNTSSGEVHGKYARVYALSWTIDGEELPAGTPLADIVRNLWHGTERVGKNSKDLAELLDKVAPTWKTTNMDDQTFTVNGHEVTISQSGPDDE